MSAVVRRELGALGRELKTAAGVSVGSGMLLVLIEVTDWLVFDGGLDAYGVHPRSLVGLGGILTMPFLHAGFGHLVGNLLAGVPLAFLSMERSAKDFLAVVAVSGLTAGLGAWLFGAGGSVHIGASGVVFGLLGFLMLRGVFERRIMPILMSLFVGLGWGGMLLGLVPGLFAGVSWQAHLFGFAGGALVARMLGTRLRQKAPTPS